MPDEETGFADEGWSELPLGLPPRPDPASPDRPGPSRWRKLPAVIEAWQLTPENAGELLRWIDAGKQYIGADGRLDGLTIFTLEGRMKADFGDWVIKGVKGEFYPCKPDVFEQTYEPAGDAP